MSELRSYPFDQAAAEIFFNAEHGGGQGLLKGLRGELSAVLAVHTPVALKCQDGADVNLRHGADDRDQIAVSLGAAFDDGIAVLLVLICNSFNNTAQTLHTVTSRETGYLILPYLSPL